MASNESRSSRPAAVEARARRWDGDLRLIEEVDTEPAFDETVALAAELTTAPMAAITMLDDEFQWFKAKIGLEGTGTPRDIAFCRYTILESTPMVVNDALRDPRFQDNPLVTGDLGVRSYAGAPLILSDGSRIGAVCVLDTVPRNFDKREVQALELLARHTVSQLQREALIKQQHEDLVALEDARRQLNDLAGRDALTNVLNRRGLLDSIAEDAIASQTNSVLFIDINGFKAVNDSFGHEFGDRVLVEVARRVNLNARDSDKVARIGGDEFVVLLPGLGLEQAQQIAQTIRHAAEEPIEVDGVTVVIGLSIGVGAQAGVLELSDLIEKADSAMYIEKRLTDSS